MLRGGAGFFVPFGHQSIDEVGARASFVANFAFGYYFTPHDLTPFGDLVWYLSTNVAQTIDNNNSPSRNTVTLTPGFRTHLGQNWYFLGAVEVPVAHVKTQAHNYPALALYHRAGYVVSKTELTFSVTLIPQHGDQPNV